MYFFCPHPSCLMSSFYILSGINVNLSSSQTPACTIQCSLFGKFNMIHKRWPILVLLCDLARIKRVIAIIASDVCSPVSKTLIDITIVLPLYSTVSLISFLVFPQGGNLVKTHRKGRAKTWIGSSCPRSCICSMK